AYELFVEGGKEGIEMAFTLLPFLLGMIVAISILRSSGALEAFVGVISPILIKFGVPPEIIPLAFSRPISGTAALGIMSEITETYESNYIIGRSASTTQRSTDTTLNIFTVYFGAVGMQKMRYALKVRLLADLAGMIAAITIVYCVFR